jgi:hypothetical protein
MSVVVPPGARSLCIQRLARPAAGPLAVLALFLSSSSVVATALPEEMRASLIKSAEQSCFEGQSKQETNKARRPEVLRRFCNCFAEKMSYTMTMEGAIASIGKPPTSEEQQVMDAVLANCWQVHVR